MKVTKSLHYFSLLGGGEVLLKFLSSGRGVFCNILTCSSFNILFVAVGSNVMYF